MGIYSGAEVFQIAMELEETGRVFYQTLSEESEDHDLADLCRGLAAQETAHYEKFKKMSDELVQRPTSRPLTWDELNFAQILIEERVITDSESAREAARSGDAASVLDTAIQIEKDSVLFYNEMLEEVDKNDAPAIQEIIDEEKRHVRTLIDAKKRLQSKTS
jgi:rubrerythrin